MSRHSFLHNLLLEIWIGLSPNDRTVESCYWSSLSKGQKWSTHCAKHATILITQGSNKYPMQGKSFFLRIHNCRSVLCLGFIDSN